jgi:aryl-alcohol dehydrogenase-like predicted oxidoreductase
MSISTIETISLGKTEIRITPLGVGTWQWGDSVFWGYGRSYAEDAIRSAFEASLAAGLNFFDTAEVYGQGRSERFLGRFLSLAGTRPAAPPPAVAPPVVATKFMPLPWRLSKGQLVCALRGSLRRLGLSRVDLYQLHWPYPPQPVEFWAEALADVVEAGLARAVGVSNYDVDQMRRAHAVLAKRGVPLASNQVQYSLLERTPERTGLVNACRELGVTLIAWSPLAKGALTGKYTPDNPPPGFRGRRYRGELLANLQPLISLVRDTGARRGGKSPAQVALNWLICKGAIPIPGAKDARQAQDNAGALGWRLTADDVAALDAASERVISR